MLVRQVPALWRRRPHHRASPASCGADAVARRFHSPWPCSRPRGQRSGSALLSQNGACGSRILGACAAARAWPGRNGGQPAPCRLGGSAAWSAACAGGGPAGTCSPHIPGTWSPRCCASRCLGVHCVPRALQKCVCKRHRSERRPLTNNKVKKLQVLHPDSSIVKGWPWPASARQRCGRSRRADCLGGSQHPRRSS